jgi:hypothetical protein
MKSKILDIITTELSKPEIKKKIEAIVSSVSNCILQQINPYIITIVSIMLLTLILQGFLLTKLFFLHNEISRTL